MSGSGSKVDDLFEALSLVKKSRDQVAAIEAHYKAIGNRPAELAPGWSGERRAQFDREIAQYAETAAGIRKIADRLFDAGERYIRKLIDINNSK